MLECGCFLLLYERIRLREKPYSGIFYAVSRNLAFFKEHNTFFDFRKNTNPLIKKNRKKYAKLGPTFT